eukprot:6160137-Pleurochrysis_carterae.AAC.1
MSSGPGRWSCCWAPTAWQSAGTRRWKPGVLLRRRAEFRPHARRRPLGAVTCATVSASTLDRWHLPHRFARLLLSFPALPLSSCQSKCCVVIVSSESLVAFEASVPCTPIFVCLAFTQYAPCAARPSQISRRLHVLFCLNARASATFRCVNAPTEPFSARALVRAPPCSRIRTREIVCVAALCLFCAR